MLIQRVTRAQVQVAGETIAAIGPGLLVLIGIGRDDTEDDGAWLAGKLLRLRIFPDAAGLMNRSVVDHGGGILVVSQFTLWAGTASGNRPSFTAAARPELAVPLYERFLAHVAQKHGQVPQSGRFGADMQVELVNDGPVTIWMDSRRRE